jgi:hypothetical protein
MRYQAVAETFRDLEQASGRLVLIERLATAARGADPLPESPGWLRTVHDQLDRGFEPGTVGLLPG